MKARRSRRAFLSLASVGAAGAALLAGPAARGDEGETKAKPKGKEFSGTSKKGNLQEAVELAIKTAMDAAPGADRQIRWALKGVSGLQGGLVPANDVTVTIEATFG
jgi:hypothetical protein